MFMQIYRRLASCDASQKRWCFVLKCTREDWVFWFCDLPEFCRCVRLQTSFCDAYLCQMGKFVTYSCVGV